MSNNVTSYPQQQQHHHHQIRLYFVRHGETIANVQNHVIGQTDSPLTELGQQQAIALGKWLSKNMIQSKSISNIVQKNDMEIMDNIDDQNSTNISSNHPQPYFWRIYSSDLGRTKHTTQLIVQQWKDNQQNCDGDCNDVDNTCNNYNTNDAAIIYDDRLREIARGLRQGLSKRLTYDEAIQVYKNQQHPYYQYTTSNKSDDTATATTTDNTTTALPKLETDDDAWDRMYTSWLMNVMNDAVVNDDDDENNKSNSNGSNTSIHPIHCKNVLIVTHAAILRVFITRLLGEDVLQQMSQQDCTIKDRSTDNSNSSSKGRVIYKYDNPDTAIPINYRLHIPNTSLTILNIHYTLVDQRPPVVNVPDHISDVNTKDVDLNKQACPLVEIQNIDVEKFTGIDHYKLISSLTVNLPLHCTMTEVHITPTTDTIRLKDNVEMVLHIWNPSETTTTSSSNNHQNIKGIVILYHGFLAHGLYPTVRYAAELLYRTNQYIIVAPDLRGHGLSISSSSTTAATEGDSNTKTNDVLQHYLPNCDIVLQDSVQVVQYVKEKYSSISKIFLTGSSMGGTIALTVAQYITKNPSVLHSTLPDGSIDSNTHRSIAGVILLAPMLQLSVSTIARTALSLLSYIIPTWEIIPSSSTNSTLQYRDPEKRLECEQASIQGTTSSGKIRVASASTCVELTHYIQNEFTSITTPYLLLVADEDVVVKNDGATQLYTLSPSTTDKTIIHYDALHGLLCEPKPLIDTIHNDILKWIQARS